jgi:hypothetical protein
VPTGHVKQEVTFVVKLPAGHVTHELSAVAPVTVENFPVTQLVQFVAPALPK